MKRSCSTTPPLGSGSAAAISPSISTASRASKLSSAALRNALERTAPPTTSPSMVQIAAAAIRRAASELSLNSAGPQRGIFQTVAQAAHSLDQIGVQLLAQAADEDFDGVGIPVE